MANKPKTMISSNIRISKINNTKQGQKIYEKEEILRILDKWQEEKQLEYFFIEHNEDLENIHYHIVIKYSSSTRFDTIKSKFPYGNIESSKSVKNSVQYLIHLNDPQKVQYNWSDIVTNSKELNKYMLKSKVSEELDLKYYIEQIDKGNIKQHELWTKIPIELYSNNKAKINNAMEFYTQRIVQDKNRKIEVIFIQGKSGTGKTTWAKYQYEFQGKSYCVSSSSNDPLQDYKGEDVLILDDLRDDSFKFDDILKILDNHTRSSIKSRYNNKQFIGQTIVITSTIELNDWYKCDRKYEEIHQLHRRIPYMLKMINNGKEIDFYKYNECDKRYLKIVKKQNPFYLEPEQEKEALDDFIGQFA